MPILPFIRDQLEEMKKELMRLFTSTPNGKHFKYKKELKNPEGRTFCTVEIKGYKAENVAQYIVEVKWWYGLIVKGEVKRAQMYINVEGVNDVKGVIRVVNGVLGSLDILKHALVIPSDCGAVREIHIIFQNVEGVYEEKTVVIPLHVYL